MSDQTILIDLDALLDTRLGAISQVNADAAVIIMQNGYWERDEDNFQVLSKGLITNAQFKECYEKRNVETLKASVLTRIVDVIGTITRELQRKQAARVEVGEIKLVVNFAPYSLEKELRDVIIDSIRPYVAINCIVEGVYRDLASLTPQHVDSLCDMYILYDYNGWMVAHHEELLASPTPMMTYMVPMIQNNKSSVSEEDLKDPASGMIRDQWKLHQLALAEFIGIEFQPAFVFSMIH